MTRTAVVGGGLGGWTAAVAAAEAGSEVTLFEKEACPGGSTVLSGGFLALAGTSMQQERGIPDSSELLEADLIACGRGHADPDLVHAYASGQGDFVDWLLEHGLVIRDIEWSSGQTVARSHRCDPRAFLAELQQRAQSEGVEAMYGAAVTELIVAENGDVTGVIVNETERSFDSVVLATGGFSRSEVMLSRHAPSQVGAVRVGGAGSTGDGLVMGQSAGAATRDFEFVKGTFGAHPTTRPDQHELLLLYYTGAVIVNTDGQRFIDESTGYKLIGDACLRQPGQTGFQIWDQAILERSPVGVPLFDPRPMIERGLVHKAADLWMLARAVGVDPGRLAGTIEQYNRVARGTDPDELGRTGLVNGSGGLEAIEHPPFYAFESKTALIATYCGLSVDTEARVLHRDGSHIPGLRAVGEVVGGFHGASYMTGTSLGKAAFFGRLAGEASARNPERTG